MPQAFGLTSGPEVKFPLVKKQEKNGWCICDLPVGMYPDIAEVCLELADDAFAEAKLAQLLAAGELTS